MLWWDPMYFVFALPPLLLGFVAQAWVKSAYRKGLNIRNDEGITGVQAAEQLAYHAGLGIDITVIGGELTDKYDPRNNTLMLSQGVARSPSVGALAIVAHELGQRLEMVIQVIGVNIVIPPPEHGSSRRPGECR